MLRASALLLLCLLVPACLAAPGLPSAPPALAAPELAYNAGFRPSEPPATTPATEALPDATVSVQLVALDLATARALEGHALGGPGAWTTNTAALAGFLRAAPRGSEFQAPTLASAERWRFLAPERQLAHVADFAFQHAGGSMVADPVIEIARTGTRVRARSTRTDDGRLDVAVELHDCARYGPLQEEKARVPGFEAALTLQAPRLFTQDLSTQARLAPDECLVLAWSDVERPERRLFALVTAAAVPVSGTD